MPRRDTDRGRFYDIEIDGCVHTYPSVTHTLQAVNKPKLVSWAAEQERELVKAASLDLYLEPGPKMTSEGYLRTLKVRLGKEKAHQKKLREAGDIGSQIHAIIEWNLRKSLGQAVGKEPPITEEALWGYMAWEDWSRSVKLTPLFIESTIWSVVHKYAGTADLIGKVDGKLCVVDWKSSKGKAIYPEYKLQVAAYAKAIDEMGHGPVESGIIVKLPKDKETPEFVTETVSDLDEKFKVYLAVRELWQYLWDEESARKGDG